mgnify:CR=1 FL=1
MKNVRIILILLLVIIIGGCSNAKEDSIESFEFGKINSFEKFTSNEIPNVSFYYYGDQVYTLNISEFKLNKYNITTSINGVQDTNDWVGIKVTDIIKTLNEDSTKISVYAQNGIMSRAYDDISNLYVLVEKNGELIKLRSSIDEWNNLIKLYSILNDKNKE